MEKILLDTDIGGDIDDAICLAYLLKEPRCELVGVTTVCGEPEKRAAVADAICETVGRIIPIVAGLDSTMQPVPVYPTPDGADALKFWKHNTYEKADAPAFLYQNIKQNPHEIILIGIGNMTNIATLFTTYPDAAGLLKGLYVMNGYFDEAPLPEPYYNWNSWADPLASKIVFSSNVSVHRAIPLEVTDTLTIEAKQARVLLNSDSDLMKSVFSFGGAWLEKSEKLTLHDPLAAVSVFYPDICSFERGNVQVETNFESNMGGTSFAPSQKGNVEIARIVDREQFYRILSTTLCGENKKVKQRHIPQLVVSRAKSVGTVGEAWLANLDNMVSELEKEWHISVEDALSGGTHALVANADGENGEKYVLKIDMPEDLGGEFSKEISVLKTANGKSYTKLYAYDIERKACLLERLGKPIDKLDYTVQEKLQIICMALQKVWELPVENAELITGDTSWFNEFLESGYEKLNHPCPRKVIEQALVYLKSRTENEKPDEFVMLHGDAHGENTLKSLTGEGFKFIDPDGIFYEKAYDLGVLMREWREEYEPEPMKAGKERCSYLHHLTSVPEQEIWEWGYIQMVSTAFVMLQIGQEETGHKMLRIAECWNNKSNPV
ncbi:nucleoside hydrolase [Catenibacillus scindens]|uniref:nucleoside hydrolase n=1 Tax=Catenibacillus scindens TaxID=673271 RepID=UPI00320A6EEB